MVHSNMMERARKNTSSAVKQQRGTPKTSIDYFPTPPWATRALMERIRLHAGHKVLEPAAGGGHMETVIKEYDVKVDAADLYDPANKGYAKKDFLDPNSYGPLTYDWVITNPPFNLAAEFALRGLQVADRVALLCRIAFLESVKRYNTLFSQQKLQDIFVFAERVAMVEGRLDLTASSATCYAWLIFKRDWNNPAIFGWIPPGTKQRLTKTSDKELENV